MISRAKGAWDWFLGGLAEAALWVLNRFRRPALYRIEVGDGQASVKAPGGSEIGKLVDAGGAARFEPPALVERLTGAMLELSVPAKWLFRRDLDPVAAQSVPFLDAFVRHHIERVTPWRVADVHYRIRQNPLPADPTRVEVELGVVPRRLIKVWVEALEPLHPRRLQVVSQEASSAPGMEIRLGDGSSQMVRELRQRIAIALLAVGLGFSGATGWLWWQVSLVQADIEDQDRVMDERKLVLARAQQRDQDGQDGGAKLRQIRASRPRAADVLEALSEALPDSAYLTDFELEKDHLTIGGTANDMSRLVPALEKSGRFADVAFGAATTKVEAGPGDRFRLDMRILPPASAPP